MATLPTAWIVTCPGCGCSITFAAIDPQVEHMDGKADAPPVTSGVLGCPCCGSAYRYSQNDIRHGVPGRENCRRKKEPGRPDGALLVAASVVAAIRLRGQEVKPSPQLTSTIKDSVRLAEMLLAELRQRT
jgi:hypothetical protein